MFKNGFDRIKGNGKFFQNHPYKIHFAFVEKKLWAFENNNISVGGKIVNPL